MDKDKMIAEQEIQQRKAIMNNRRISGKLTESEKEWLCTHRIYHPVLGYPFLNADLIELEKNAEYEVFVSVEKSDYDDEIYPMFTIPAKKGFLLTDFPVTNLKGKTSIGKAITCLCLQISQQSTSSDFRCLSESGLLQVCFSCKYQCPHSPRVRITENSDCGPALVMKREIISENKYLYHCKSPVSDSFDNLVFSVTWTKK